MLTVNFRLYWCPFVTSCESVACVASRLWFSLLMWVVLGSIPKGGTLFLFYFFNLYTIISYENTKFWFFRKLRKKNQDQAQCGLLISLRSTFPLIYFSRSGSRSNIFSFLSLSPSLSLSLSLLSLFVEGVLLLVCPNYNMEILAGFVYI